MGGETMTRFRYKMGTVVSFLSSRRDLLLSCVYTRANQHPGVYSGIRSVGDE